MDHIILPVVSGDDRPEAAINQMRLSDARAVVVRHEGSYRILSNRDILRAASRGIERLGDLRRVGRRAVDLEPVGKHVWKVLGTARRIFEVADRRPNVQWHIVESTVGNALAGSGFGVVQTHGSAAVVVTESEHKTARLRTQPRFCNCEHEPRVVREKRPDVTDGAECVHGGGNWRCC